MSSPRIYNLFPLLVGPVAKWEEHLPRIADMRFNWVFLNPFHQPGGSGSLYAVKDYYRLNPVFQGEGQEPPDELLRRFLARANKHQLAVMMDLVINHTAKDSPLAKEHANWYARNEDGSLRSPRATDSGAPGNMVVWEDLAELDYDSADGRQDLLNYWKDVVRHYAKLGFPGFRCDAALMMPIGYEYGFRKKLHVVKTRPGDWEKPAFDLSAFIAAANEMKEHTPVLNEEGPQERITPAEDSLVGLLRRSDHSGERAVALINTETDQQRDFGVADLQKVLEAKREAIREITPSASGDWADGDKVSLPPLAVRIFHHARS
jgi:Glycogen debranching enzyme, glucanotransferase domain